ncbi:MAG: polysaccharide deacetylase family protein [Gemmatimonas sp.]
MPSKRLLVSIHDVTPALEQPVRALWQLCRAHGVTPALLVVPDWHGAWPIERHPLFMDWVRARSREGAEIILHGERHDEVGLPRGWRDMVRAVGRTAREGEFLTLNHAAARTRIARGLSRLTDQQLAPIGFIPPAWLARGATHDAVREAGLVFSEDDRAILLHRFGTRLVAPVLRWSARTAARAWGSRIMAAVRWRAWQQEPLLRLALHPQDLSHPATNASVQRDVGRWTRARTVIRYDAL